MISAASLPFLGFALAVLLAQILAPGRIRASILFPIANFCFLYMVMPDWKAMLLLIGFLVLSYITIWTAARKKRLMFTCALVTVLLYFAWVKGYPIFAELPIYSHMPVVIGLSYILIRSLQVAIDTYEGTLPIPLSPWRLFNFVCCWPMLLSGPIQSYQKFDTQQRDLPTFRLTGYVFSKSLARLAWGLFSVIVLADQALNIHSQANECSVRDCASQSMSATLGLPQSYLDHSSLIDWLFAPGVLSKLITGTGSYPLIMLAISQMGYLIYLYLNFSGYTHIVIGVGGFMGLKLPENFNRPWASKSFLDLWTRWHMTLANWFKAYVFNKVVSKLLRSWPSKTMTPYYAVIAFFVTFFLVGVWHGPTWPYFLCGFGLGVGVSVNKLWQLQFRKRFGKKAEAWISSIAAYEALSGALALAYLAVTIIPFWTNKDEIVKMSFSYGLFGLVLSYFIMAVMIYPVIYFYQSTESHADRFIAFMRNPWFVGIVLAATCIYLFFTPDVDVKSVYQGF
ncbi:MAG: MBOAT family O-acyltransferase [Pseudomonadota bacterium]